MMLNFDNWEEYKGLPSDQEEDFYKFFCEYIFDRKLTYREAVEHFQPDSDTFVEFILAFESRYSWFDYRQMEEIFQELSLYLIQMEEDELSGFIITPLDDLD